MIRISVESQETIRVPFGQVDANGDTSDPTGTTPQFALVALGDSPSSWANGSWETSTDSLTLSLGFQMITTPYKARYTIDGTASAVGEYHLWFKLGSFVKKLDKVEIT